MLLDVRTTYYALVKRDAGGGSAREHVAMTVPVKVATARLGDSDLAIAYAKDGRRRELRHMDGKLYERIRRSAEHADDAEHLVALAGNLGNGGRYSIGLDNLGHGPVVSQGDPGVKVQDKDGKMRAAQEAKVRSTLANVVLMDGEGWVVVREPRIAVHVRPEGDATMSVTQSYGLGEPEFRLDETDAASEYARRVGNGTAPALPLTVEFLEPAFLSPPSHDVSLVMAAKSACSALGDALPKASLDFMVRYVKLRDMVEGQPRTPSDTLAIRAALEDVLDDLGGAEWASRKVRFAMAEMDVADEFAAKAMDEVRSLAF